MSCPKFPPADGCTILQVKRCDELARKLRFFTDQVDKSGLITGLRTSTADTLELDELEVILPPASPPPAESVGPLNSRPEMPLSAAHWPPIN